MGADCSKVKICSICHEPCDTYIRIFTLNTDISKMKYCMNCVQQIYKQTTQPNSNQDHQEINIIYSNFAAN